MHTFYIKKWNEISSKIRVLNKKLFDVMDEVGSSSPELYVYEIEVPFGIDLISSGRPKLFDIDFLQSCTFKGAAPNLSGLQTFLNDFSNKTDHPLAIIESGIVEIYESKTYYLFKEPFSYNFPLNILSEGEILGSFGATDLIFDSQLKSPLYTYSAWSGNICLQPLLPKTFEAKASYQDIIKKKCKDLNLAFNPAEHICSFFPKLLKQLYLDIEKKLKLVLIPDKWFKKAEKVNRLKLRALISQVAWIQSRDARINELAIVPIMNKLPQTINPETIRIRSEMISYLDGILNGTRLAMKIVTKDSPNYPIYSMLKTFLKTVYDPILLEFAFLKENESGIFPLFNFPTLSPMVPIPNGKLFLNSLKESIEEWYDAGQPQGLSYYHEGNIKAFLRDYLPKRNGAVYTKLFPTRDVLKIDR